MAANGIQRQNMPYVKQQFAAILGNSSVVVKFLCVAIIVGYFLSFSSGALRALAVIPGNVLPPNFWIWTFFTHSFIEPHIWNVIVDISIIVLYGKLLEPLWGALEMLIFYLVMTIGVAITTTFFYMFIYMITQNTDYLFETPICGLAGYVAGFSVAVKQIMPDHVLINSPFGKFRNKDLPVILWILSVLARVIGAVDGSYPVMFGMGIVISWIYLRFYQKHSNGNRGDMAETFTFASFFPRVVQPVVGVVSNVIFTGLVKIKVCKKPQRKYDFSSPSTITVSLPGTDPQDAERRRQVALKALNERLNKVQSSEESEWPELDEVKTESSSTPDKPEHTQAAAAPPPPVPKKTHERTESGTVKLPVPDFKENTKSLQGQSSS